MNKDEEIDSPTKAAGAVIDNITNKGGSSNNNSKRKREASSSSSSASRSSKKKPSTSANPVQVNAVVHALPRNALEQLISKSLSTATPLTMERLLAFLPETKQWKATGKNPSKSSTATVKGPSRTGRFDSIDDEVMRQILMFLPLRERIICVSRICKPWRNLANLEGLFADLSGSLALTKSHFASKNQDVSYYLAREKELASIKAENTLSLLHWHPKPNSIVALRLQTSKICNPNTCKNIIKLVSKLKQPKKRSDNVPPLTKLVLHGPKITQATLKALESSPIISSRQLTEFTLIDVKESKLNDGGVLEILKRCPNLEILCMSQEMLLKKSLELHFTSLSSARSYEPTVLRVLDLSQWSWRSGVDLSSLERLATYCPELEVLKLYNIDGLPSAAFPPKYSEYDDPVPIPAGFCAQPMQVLPRLKTFHVTTMVGILRYTTTACVEVFLKWLLRGTPVLEDMSFSLGQSEYIRGRDSKVFRLPKELTTIGNSLWSLPLTLKRLSLIKVVSQSSQILSLGANRSLETLELYGCGPDMLDELRDLQQGRKLVLSVKYGSSRHSKGNIVAARLSKHPEKGFTKYDPDENDIEKLSTATATAQKTMTDFFKGRTH